MTPVQRGELAEPPDVEIIEIDPGDGETDEAEDDELETAAVRAGGQQQR